MHEQACTPTNSSFGGFKLEPADITEREETTAEDIFTRWRTDILKHRLKNRYRRGNNGAPSQPEKRIGSNKLSRYTIINKYRIRSSEHIQSFRKLDDYEKTLLKCEFSK